MDANLISWHGVVVSQLKLKLFEIAIANQLLTGLQFEKMQVRKSENTFTELSLLTLRRTTAVSSWEFFTNAVIMASFT